MPYDFSTWDRNCAEEQVTPITGAVTGTVPPWLRGSFFLNGPGKMKYGDHEYKHVFDGAAILQKFNFTENGPVYSSRFLKSNAYLMNTESQQIVVSEFGTKGNVENKGLLQKLGNKFSFDKMFSDNAAIGIVSYGGELYANTEAPFLHKFDPDTLDTKEKIDLHKELGVSSQCPHPIMLKDGSSLNILHNVGATGPRYDILNFPAQPIAGKPSVFSKPTKVASVDARWKLNPCHLHSFGLTENYIILPEQPLTMDVKAMVANTVKDRPFIDGMEWIKDKLVKLHVIARDGGKELKIKFKSEAFFFLHIINCYEQDGHIVVDFCAFKKPDLLYILFLKKLRENGENYWKELELGSVIRLVLPLEVNDKSSPEENLVKLAGSKAKANRQKDGVVQLTPEVITDVCYENPTMNQKFVTQKYNFFWGLSGDMVDSAGKVGKVDVRSGEVKIWSKTGMYGCVVVFVPRPGSEVEDDGVVLVSCVHGGSEKSKSSIVVLDAASMNELATITYATPSDAPRSLHGLYVAA